MTAKVYEFPRDVSDLAATRRAVDEVKALIHALAPFETIAAALDRYADERILAAPPASSPSDTPSQEQP